MSKPDRIPVICGPTGSGKTAVAVQLGDQRPVEVVSADSRQIIRHLDIGTAKPTVDERRRTRFHLIDLIEPGERYSAFRFIVDASRVIREIVERGHIPLVVGGTGLYLRALSEGVVEIEQEDMELRQKLEQEMEVLGSEAMHKRLESIDPLEAARIHPNNRVRVIRALEIYYLTGRTKSELVISGAYKKVECDFDYHCLALPREQLYERINDRVDRMIAHGWLDEVAALEARGMKGHVRKANVLGYGELLDVLEGKYRLDEAVTLIKQNTRRYAKRQMTWFRHQAGCTFYETPSGLLEALRRS